LRLSCSLRRSKARRYRAFFSALSANDAIDDEATTHHEHRNTKQKDHRHERLLSIPLRIISTYDSLFAFLGRVRVVPKSVSFMNANSWTVLSGI
jgi:hypothetical protein